MRLHDALDYHARQQPDVELIICGETRLTYAEARAAANRFANALIAAGVQPGDRIALLAKNCAEYIAFFYGASKAGAVPVPLNYRLAPPEWRYIIDDAQATLLFARADLVSAIEPVRGQLETVRDCIAIEAAPPAGWHAWSDWAASHPGTEPAREIRDDGDLYQMYTSGTTGHPKGAVLTHRAVMSNVTQLDACLRGIARERVLIVAPLYHAAAGITAIHAVTTGCTLVIHEEFNPAAVVDALATQRIARTTLVPAMIQACLVMVPDVAKHPYDSLRLVAYGASPISEATLRRAIEVFQCDFAQAYGMTETSAVLTILDPDDHRRALESQPGLLLSAGRAVMGTRLRIVDEQGDDAPEGAVGEIVARGPQLMRGYWNLPDATATALRGGWMHTGDAARIDGEGYVYIQDRVKDMIVSGGENIYPREVEEVLFQHPAVADAAVFGVPDATFGEAVKAVVVLRAGMTATDTEIMEFCKGRLGGYKRPRSVDFSAALPRNPSGKVLKRELREPYWKGHTRRVG
jgi:acyl-CoA synthetase (AMP-forming)/AMP-acid ligase II